MPNLARPLGRVLTFYSYKGGTGRSMAMANVAWILASSGRRVLAIDWDLEAPGLHRYFRPFLIDDELMSSDGLMDLVDNYAVAAIRPAGTSPPEPEWYVPFTDFSDYTISINFPHFPTGGRIDLMPAGRQVEHYATLVSTFNWQNFYDRLGGGGFFEALKARARAQYDYILIDSRTGVSDTAGICSVQMPETLVVCFTYNNQSIKGASSVARSAIAMHDQLVNEKLELARSGKSVAVRYEDLSIPFRVFPVPMRVDSGESERLALRQAFAQHAFSGLTDHLVPDIVARYWRSVEVPQTSFYSYEEVLAPFKDDPYDPKTVLAAFLSLTRHITDSDVTEFRMPISPHERQRYLDAFAETVVTTRTQTALAESQRETDDQALVRNADAALATLTQTEREAARRVLSRVVRLGRDEDVVRYTPTRVPLSEFQTAERAIVDKLASHRIVTLTPASTDEGETTVGLADGKLLSAWSTLIDWLESDREFLAWRQRLRLYLADWERSGRDPGALLNGRLLSEADLNALKRGDDLNDTEKQYISDSRAVASTPAPAAAKAVVARSLAPWWIAATAAVAVLIAAGIWLTSVPFAGSGSTAPGNASPASGTIPAVIITVPQLVGLPAREAQSIVKKSGLKVEINNSASLPASTLEGIVVEQSPAQGKSVQPGGTVRLTLSNQTVRAPTVIGMDLNTALKAVAGAQLKLRATDSAYVPNAKDGTVVTQTPAAGTQVAVDTAVDVVVARPAQLSDFRFGIYFRSDSAESGALADRLAAFLGQNETSGDLLARDAAFFETRLRSSERHEIRYSTPVERRMAEQLVQRLQRADQFPPFTLRQVALRSEGFISIVLANVSAIPPVRK